MALVSSIIDLISLRSTWNWGKSVGGLFDICSGIRGRIRSHTGVLENSQTLIPKHRWIVNSSDNKTRSKWIMDFRLIRKRVTEWSVRHIRVGIPDWFIGNVMELFQMSYCECKNEMRCSSAHTITLVTVPQWPSQERVERNSCFFTPSKNGPF